MLLCFGLDGGRREGQKVIDGEWLAQGLRGRSSLQSVALVRTLLVVERDVHVQVLLDLLGHYVRNPSVALSITHISARLVLEVSRVIRCVAPIRGQRSTDGRVAIMGGC